MGLLVLGSDKPPEWSVLFGVFARVHLCARGGRCCWGIVPDELCIPVTHRALCSLRLQGWDVWAASGCEADEPSRWMASECGRQNSGPHPCPHPNPRACVSSLWEWEQPVAVGEIEHVAFYTWNTTWFRVFTTAGGPRDLRVDGWHSWQRGIKVANQLTFR